MNNFKTISVMAAAAAFMCVAPTVAMADQWNKKTVITFAEPIQLPNVVLQPGTYVIKLLESSSDRHIVQVFDKDDQHLITTILAIPNYRLQPTGKTQFQFWETPAGQPKAMRAWFYPGDNFGQEFAYPKSMSMEIATYSKMPVPSTSAQSSDEMKTATVSAINETGQASDLDAKTYVRPEPAPVAVAVAVAPTPEPAPTVAQSAPTPVRETVAEPVMAPMPAELPSTASFTPLIGLIGLVSLSISLMLGYARRVR